MGEECPIGEMIWNIKKLRTWSVHSCVLRLRRIDLVHEHVPVSVSSITGASAQHLVVAAAQIKGCISGGAALLPRRTKDHMASTFVRAITEPCLETVHVALMMPKAKLE